MLLGTGVRCYAASRSVVFGQTEVMSAEPILNPDVLAYYNQGREHSRLETTSLLEYLRTTQLLGDFCRRRLRASSMWEGEMVPTPCR